jgi:hypothetical protein
MIIRAHVVISSTNPQADCAFLRDVLRLGNVDDDGYLIFGLPPAEASVHPSDKNDVHQLYLMCEDVGAFISAMEKHHIVCDPVQDEGWGLLTRIALPGGGKLAVYQPRHARPPATNATPPAPKPARRASAKPE